jgi:CTP synthase
LGALRIARERKVPFLAVGDAHELVLIEVARNVLGMEKATGAAFEDDAAEAISKELPRPYRPLTNRKPTLIDVAVRQDPTLSAFLPPGRREEAARLNYGLNPDYAFALEEAGLRVAGVDAVDGRPCLWRLEGSPWHVTAAFLPQLSGGREAHPLIRGFVSHVAGRR